MTRAYHLKRIYGITEEQYEAMLEAQDHRCAICGQHESHFKTKLAVEHNHKTGVIRGLACYLCNKFCISICDRYPQRVERALQYVKANGLNTGWRVPAKTRTKSKKKRRK